MKLQYKSIIAIIYTIVLFLDRLDLTIINVTLPTIAQYFHVPITTTDWINISFLLALAISIPISSWLAGHFGSKRIFLWAMFLFGVGATLCFWTPNLNYLIFLRFIQGLGGGMLIPVGMTMLYRAHERKDYARITSLVFLSALIAPAISPFLGGIILEHYGWRPVFLFSGPFSLILLVFSYFYIKEDKTYKHQKPFDWFGYGLSSTLLIDLFLILSRLGNTGFTQTIAIQIIVFFTFLFIFIKWENKIQYPLINLGFFQDDLFVKVNIIQLCFQACHFGAIFLVGMYLQVGIGMSASMTGLIMGMQAIGAMVTVRYSVKLLHQYGPKLPIILGLLGVAILSPCTLLIINPTMVFFGIAIFLFRGMFSGLCGAPIQTLSIINFSKNEIDEINSIFNICRQIAISLGIAISSLLISIGFKLTKDRQFSTAIHQSYMIFGWGFLMISILALLGLYTTTLIKSADFKLQDINKEIVNPEENI